jgi:hypothetical protein
LVRNNPTQAKRRCKVPRHPLQFVSEDPLQFLVMNAPQPWEGKWETLCVFQGGKPPSFPPLSGLTNPTFHHSRLVGVEVEFADHRVTVVDQDTLFYGDDLYPLPAECAAEVPLPAIYLELAVRIHLT